MTDAPDQLLLHDPAAADGPDALAAALAGVRALVLDADGVLIRKGVPLPGAPAALVALRAAGIPFRVVTNFSSTHRETIAGQFAKAGFPIDADHVITAASATAAYTAATHPGEPLYVLGQPDALREFVGQRLLSNVEADAPDARAAAVVLGDAGDDLTFRDLDRAFRLLRRGAALVAMHRNPWWLTSRGETLDAGVLVAGLEFAIGRRAIVCGKPSRVVYREAVAALAVDLGIRRLAPEHVAMVGDDLGSDVAGARRCGLRSVLVLSGKHGPADVEAARRGGRRTALRVPNAVAPSIAEVVDALVSGGSTG